MINESYLVDYVVQQAVNVYFVDSMIFALVVTFVFVATLMANQISFGSSLVMGLPLFFLINALGMYAGLNWIVIGVMLVVGIIYGTIIIRLFSD